ncbi:hypothetical protein [Actinoplanes derwentensis]|uniref:Uncharacterized protein n=1 Tax=Actinoplanes derwentensis TaxID=113562 RepID=A0A1H1Z9L3_9ACTN|nr:hypothetical protein [Actinoplanes derwentensis]GID82328.1 hypothetical protein Ade03nite_12520 [Actinoplanes derwentensis]SDT30461.1 hypothetical protein SAMN04489716_3214 [Actinoplanes derwentensis]
MTYALLLQDSPDRQRLASAIAAVLSVPIESVDVAEDGDDNRNWKAPVICTVTSIGGDLRQSILIYVADTSGENISQEIAAARLAERLKTPVAYEAMPIPPDMYWLVGADGRRSRARINDDEDDGELVAFRVEAVEQPVAGAPDLPVGPVPEVIHSHRIPTPLTDQFRGSPASDGTGWVVVSRLASWEIMITRLIEGWPPDGWYPAEYYRDDLGYRDDLVTGVGELPDEVRGDFAEVLATLDRRFAQATVDDAGRALAAATGPVPDRWWWHRITDPLPWHDMPGG